MALIARDVMKDAAAAQQVPRLRPGPGELHNPRVRLQGLLQFLRHEGIQHRGPADLLGRQVLRQVPQARPHRSPAGHRRPGRIPRQAAGRRCSCRPARQSRTTVGIPRTMFFYDRFPFWCAYFQELGFDVVISSPHRPQDRGRRRGTGRSRSRASPSRWRTATCRSCWTRAWITFCSPTSVNAKIPEQPSARIAPVSVEPDAALRGSRRAADWKPRATSSCAHREFPLRPQARRKGTGGVRQDPRHLAARRATAP